MGYITNYFIILTRACNLKCQYCGEDAAFEQPPIDIAYSLHSLKNYFLKDSTEVTVQFYGGEPLLRIPLMEDIMDLLPNVAHWSVQTNAINLHKVQPHYLKKLDTILVSIDGRREVNDANRGVGVYDKILQNCLHARKHGFAGDLIARMTVSEVADIYEEVLHLASLTEPVFNHIHWQIDSQWDDDPNSRWHNFAQWVDSSYNQGISKLVIWWLNQMQEGIFVGLVPFIPIMRSILFNIPSGIRCGAGLDSFTINPDGKISVCPISPEFNFSLVGHIQFTDPSTIRNSLKIIAPCPQCSVYHICGGRCLFINHTKLWGQTLYDKVCSTVKHMINELIAIKNDVLELLKEGIISKIEFDYPKYNNGCEIIP